MDDARSMDVLLAGIIAAARLDAGLTQVDLARSLDRPQSYVAKIEAGDRRVGAVELVLIAQALGLDAGDMLAQLPPAPAARVRRSGAARSRVSKAGGAGTALVDVIASDPTEVVNVGRAPKPSTGTAVEKPCRPRRKTAARVP